MTEECYAAQAERAKMQLYKIAVAYTGNQTLAVDMVDEAIYKGFIKLRSLKNPDQLGTWLTRILLNLLHTKTRRSQREVALEKLPAQEQMQLDSLPLKEAVLCLPLPLRQVIALRFFAGYTLEETAQILQLPRGTVSTRQKKALALLRLELE